MAAGWLGLWLGFVGVPVLASRRKGHASLAADSGLEVRRVDGAGLAVGPACQLRVLPGDVLLALGMDQFSLLGMANWTENRRVKPVAKPILDG